MLSEEFSGVDVDEESGLVYGPFKHASKCLAKYVSAAWKTGMLMLTLLMWREVPPMGFVTNYCTRADKPSLLS